VATTDPKAMLANVPIFEGLSKKELTEIARAAKDVTHRKGHILAREGEAGVGFFLIVEGQAGVNIGGRAVRGMGPGDFFGEISLIDGGPRTATVTADTDVRTLGITPWTFKRLIEQNPTIAAKMLKIMAARLRGVVKKPID
jgi:CRP/FNR family transcriptional regulator, cyclic AMP receptor protein